MGKTKVWAKKGFEKNSQDENSVEDYLFSALLRGKLVKDINEAQYEKAARTDKGVSAACNVVSLYMRTPLAPKPPINYPNVLNGLLPPEIRVIGVAQVTPEFSSRFHCTSRVYHYYFAKEDLDISKMQEACQKLIGSHDFRNFCKMNVLSTTNFVRNVKDAKIKKAPHRDEWALNFLGASSEIFFLSVEATAFLWHQIRCIVTILQMIGQGLEEPSIIDDMLDPLKITRKPLYTMASEIPLILVKCNYSSELKFLQEHQSSLNMFDHFRKEIFENVTETQRISSLIHCIENEFRDTNFPSDLLKKTYEKTQKNKANHLPLAKRQNGRTLEEKVGNLKGKKKNRFELLQKRKTENGEIEDKNELDS